jgi:hypothetical protein
MVAQRKARHCPAKTLAAYKIDATFSTGKGGELEVRYRTNEYMIPNAKRARTTPETFHKEEGPSGIGFLLSVHFGSYQKPMPRQSVVMEYEVDDLGGWEPTSLPWAMLRAKEPVGDGKTCLYLFLKYGKRTDRAFLRALFKALNVTPHS